MKKLLITVIFSCLALPVFASSQLLLAECNAVSGNGDILNYKVFVEESYYCVFSDAKEFKSTIVFDDTPGLTGVISQEDQYSDIVTASYTQVVAPDLKAHLKLIMNYETQYSTYTLSLDELGDIDVVDAGKLECTFPDYQMGC